ncbi:MAG: isopenicillin epimerase [Bdellovibrio sp. ArHS]|uniref:aminotransferase class V-fold PLP-dependent enzyme n=1 Tax=Bdellovibrio sp. ArHS TaxID=1569284 RepID=UPI00058300E2|nr:aminotransferase class V-fold PLP-dependent enzyme [Bdellovibrio sp. ArHS]KHD88806.1 MAG: isopenicillin epimerase [Bdellovibrio sp. ArHS]
MFQDFSTDFKKYKDTSFVNLNNGTLGLCPSAVIDQQKRELELFELNTSYSLGASWSRLWSLQQQLAAFFNADPQDLFLRPNVTLALNEIVMGLPLPKGSEILTTNFEYGAVVNILKFKARNEQLNLRFMNADFLYSDISADEAVANFAKEISEQTRVLVVSHVFTGNGIQLPLAKLAKELRKKNVWLVVDGAHAPGLFNLDFNKDLQDVDFYAGNLHKWFMGPKGTAFGWVNPALQSQLFPRYGSWTTEAELAPVMGEFRNHPFAARMLWSHSQNFSSYYGLESTLAFWSRSGKNQIFAEIQKRRNYLEDGLNRLQIKPLKSRHSEIASSLLCYKIEDFKGLHFDDLIVRDSNPRIQVGLPRVPGSPVMRLTPHIHNSQAELDTALLTLAKFV